MDNLTLTSGPEWSIADNGSSEGTLKVGETATYYASYLIEASGSDSGSIVNTAIITASSQLAQMTLQHRPQLLLQLQKTHQL